MFKALTVNLNVNFPALTDLVALLKESNKAQQRLDAATAQIVVLTARLKQSTKKLNDAVTKEKT